MGQIKRELTNSLIYLCYLLNKNQWKAACSMAEGRGVEGDVEVAHLVGQFRKQLSCPEASDALKSKQQCSLALPLYFALPSSLGHCLERERVESRRVSRAEQTRATACGTQLDPLSANRVDDSGHGLNKLESCKTRVGARPGQRQS